MSLDPAEIDGAAETRDFAFELAAEAVGRTDRIVEIVPGVGAVDEGLDRGALGFDDGRRRIGLVDVVDVTPCETVFELEAAVFIEAEPGPQREADGLGIVARLLLVVHVRGEHVEAGSDPAPHEIGVGEAEVDVLPVPACGGIDLDVVALAEEVAFLQRDRADDDFGRRVTDREVDGARRLFLDLHDQNHAVGGRSLLFEEVDLVEIVQRSQPAARTLDHDAVEGVALIQVELAADDFVLGAVVADDVDALDVGARALDDIVGDRQLLRARITLDVRIDLGEDEALARRLESEALDRLVDLGGVIVLADARRDLGDQVLRVKLCVADVDRDVRHLVARAFLDRIGNDEAIARRTELGIGGDHAHIGKAVAQVIAAQQFLVVFEAIGIVGVIAVEEAPPGILLGSDHRLQVTRAE